MPERKDPQNVVGDPEEAPRSCFVMQPFNDFGNRLYERVMKPAVEDAGLVAIRADEFWGRVGIVEKIWEELNTSSVAIADTSALNPNVMYELGLAHAVQKPVVLITDAANAIPFDIHGLAHIIYDRGDPEWGATLRAELSSAVREFAADPALGVPTVFRDVDQTAPLPPVDETSHRLAAIEQQVESLAHQQRLQSLATVSPWHRPDARTATSRLIDAMGAAVATVNPAQADIDQLLASAAAAQLWDAADRSRAEQTPDDQEPEDEPWEP